MSALKFFIGRKRHHFPENRDDATSDSDSEDLPPRKKFKDEDFPVLVKDRLQKLTNWFSEIKSINKFARMALKYGASEPLKVNPKEVEVDSEEEENSDDDVIQEIIENVEQEELSPLVKQFGRSHFSNDSGRSKQQYSMNGCFFLDSPYNPPKLNGVKARELSSRLHGTTNCNIRRDQTDKLKRRPLISNPPTDIEILLENEPTLEGDGIEILSESKNISSTSQKSCRNSVKSALPKKVVSVQKQTVSNSVRTYTANEVVRLQEKEQYKLLLDKYVKEPQYHYFLKKRQSDENIKDDSRLFPNSHFKKQVLEQPINSFIEKYYTPDVIWSKVESSEKKKEAETVTIDDDDDDVKIVDMKLPKYKAVFHSEIFTKDWLYELGNHVREQTEERNKIVEDYEQKLEKYKKERLLRQLKVDASTGAVESEFPELTPEIEEAIDNVLHGGGLTDVICRTICNNDLVRKDFDTLQGLKWLNDTIINSYFDLIVERSKKEDHPSVYAYNTFFYGKLKQYGYQAVKRWTRKIDIFSFDLNFVPIHLSFHWCLAVIDHRSKKISYYDSMGNSEECCLGVLHDYLCQEYRDKKGQVLDPSTYVTEAMKDIPQQMNGSDCGMFTLKYAEYISRNAEITFDQEHMQYFRRRTVYELFTNQFL